MTTKTPNEFEAWFATQEALWGGLAENWARAGWQAATAAQPAQPASQQAADTKPNDDLTIAYMAGYAKGVDDGVKRAQQGAVRQGLAYV
jgi:hypothetical protein